MRLVLNILWLVFAGLWLAIGYVLAAIIMVLGIITIPFAIAALRIAAHTLWPFGSTVVRDPDAGRRVGDRQRPLGTAVRLVARARPHRRRASRCA